MLALRNIDLLQSVKEEIKYYQNRMTDMPNVAAPLPTLIRLPHHPDRSDSIPDRIHQQSSIVSSNGHVYNSRPYQCTECDRAFEHAAKLERHMRIHTGERPHSCRVCGKTFVQSGQLVIHARSHTGERPYECARCDKAFTCSKQLKVHLRSHTGEKPYRCDICGKRFGYNHVLKLHQIQHFGCRVYKCTICSQTFDTKKDMEVHIGCHDAELAERLGNSGNSNVCHDDERAGYVRHERRPNSTGSTLSQSAEEEISDVEQENAMDLSIGGSGSLVAKSMVSPSIQSEHQPIAANNYYNYHYPQRVPLTSTMPFVLPSINTIVDENTSADQPLSLVVRKQPAPPKSSVIARNPLYPITMSLINDLMIEDRVKFGSRPLIGAAPDLESLMLKTVAKSVPAGLSPRPVSPALSNELLPQASLPLRKRRLASYTASDSDSETEGHTDRGSVIKFAR